VRGMDKSRGEFREVQNWIGSKGTSLEEATYIPPEWGKVEEYMYQLEKFINTDYKDYIVQLAIIHIQFEMIHPFLDGNGRIGRILIPLFLYQKNLLSYPSFYISEYFESNRSDYYNKLSAVSIEHDWDVWVSYFLRAVEEQAKKNCNKIREIHDLYNALKEVLTVDINTTYGIKVLDALFSTPYFTTTLFVRNTEIPARTSRRILAEMEERKIIKVVEEASGPKPTFYMFPELLKIVNK
jgi:Fic family protein